MKKTSSAQSKALLITGAASGIGAATARLAIERGHRVVLADLNFDGAQKLARELGTSARATALDVRKQDQWESALDFAWREFGKLDVLINNAGIVHTGFAADVSVENDRRTMDVNFFGPLIGMKSALPRFKQQGGGHLVTVCSMTAFLPFVGLASYSASKHALRAFHHSLALEERRSPIAFTIIHPTATETPMLEQEARDDAVAMAFVRDAVSPAYVADVVLTAMAKKSIEVFMPADAGRRVRLLGTNPRALLKSVEENEAKGLERQKARRAAQK